VAIAVAFLKAADQFVALAADLLKIGVGQLAPLLLHLALYLTPALKHLVLAWLATHLALALLTLLAILAHSIVSMFDRGRLPSV
jgi:hypothetical protein